MLAALYGVDATALCIAEVETCTSEKSTAQPLGRLPSGISDEKIVTLHVLGAPRYLEPLGAARHAIEPMSAMLKTLTGDASVTILDLSPSGLGFVDTRQYKADQLVEIQLLRGTTFRSVRGHVRYSHKEDGLQGIFRTGVRFLTSSQLDETAWLEYTHQAA